MSLVSAGIGDTEDAYLVDAKPVSRDAGTDVVTIKTIKNYIYYGCSRRLSFT